MIGIGKSIVSMNLKRLFQEERVSTAQPQLIIAATVATTAKARTAYKM